MRGGSGGRWADQADDESLLRSLPRRPGERRVAEPAATGSGSLRFSDDFRRLEAVARPPTSGSARGKGKGAGKASAQNWPQDMTQVFTCAVCRVDSSGEVSFVQHCRGKAHRRAAGKPGFAGLVPNAAGIEPRVTDELRAACAGADVGTSDRRQVKAAAPPTATAKRAALNEPSVVSVGLSAEHHANIRSALMRSASETELAAAPTAGSRQAAPGGRLSAPPNLHKSASLPVFGQASGSSAPAAAPPLPLPSPRPGSRPLPLPSASVPPQPVAPALPEAPAPRVEVFRRSGSQGVPPLPPPSSSAAGVRQPPLPPPPLSFSGADGREREAMQQQRAALPAAAFQDAICRAVAQHQVVVVQGETGCGKTTQVPQFLLDEASTSGQRCSIICTQPRRISAIGVAERVAAERCERIGGTVGYSIRLESASSGATRLLFCTTGILLRRLEEDPQLATVSHVVVDEVHERTMEGDFLLMVLRGLLTRRRDLRVVLMSATINAGLFATYFGAGTPTISIPGRTFPVTSLFLEDALELTGHRVRASADWARKGSKGGGRGGDTGGRASSPGPGGLCFDFTQGRCERGSRCRFAHDAQKPPPPSAPLPSAFGGMSISSATGSGGGGGGASLASRRLGGAPGGVAASDVEDEALSEAELAERYPRYGSGTVRALAALDHSQIDYELLQELVSWIMAQGSVENAQRAVGGAISNDGAADSAWDAEPPPPPARGAAPPPVSSGGGGDCILVFLPGLKEITAAHEQLTSWGPLAVEPQRGWVLPLHGSLSSEEQRRIFQRPPAGVRKIVLATNIAETSITIDDCGFVVDCGRMKETRYDPARRMESLEDVPVSRANALQRRGRAGRVRTGVAFHLVTRHTYERRLDAAQLPEMHRVPLEQLVLRIKVLRYPGTAADVVARCLEPPPPEAVSRAVAELVRLEALSVSPERGEELTPLGTHLAALPVDVRIGKLILLGAIFDVVDDVLTIAATLSYRAPFLSPFERRAEADASKRAFAVAQSDHLTALNAYREFDRGGGGRFEMCRERFLGVKTLMQIAGIKRQLLELLSDARFVRPGLRSRVVEALGRRADGSDGVRVALQEARGGPSAFSADACFRCGQRGHAARECTQPEQRRLLSANDAWERDAVNAPLIKALLTAALYPQVMTVTYPAKKGSKPLKPEQLKFHIREENQQVVEVALHPSSVNAKETQFDSQYLVFHEKVRTTRIYVRDCSTVSPYALMLFGGALGSERVKPAGGGGRRGAPPPETLLTVDGWIKFSVPRHAVDLLLQVRTEMDAVLRRKIECPDADISAAGRHILDAVVGLLSSPEGV